VVIQALTEALLLLLLLLLCCACALQVCGHQCTDPQPHAGVQGMCVWGLLLLKSKGR
jgi:hypothetical protein